MVYGRCFVVAVSLVYLTTNKGDVSCAEVEGGVYSFLAYVIVAPVGEFERREDLVSNRRLSKLTCNHP